MVVVVVVNQNGWPSMTLAAIDKDHQPFVNNMTAFYASIWIKGQPPAQLVSQSTQLRSVTCGAQQSDNAHKQSTQHQAPLKLT